MGPAANAEHVTSDGHAEGTHDRPQQRTDAAKQHAVGASLTSVKLLARSRRGFFFSSRRRHTRFDCDWSSHVCSSDLELHCPGLRHNWGTLYPHNHPSCNSQGVASSSYYTIPPRAESSISATPSPLRGGPARCQPASDRKSVVVGKECRSRWSPYH